MYRCLAGAKVIQIPAYVAAIFKSCYPCIHTCMHTCTHTYTHAHINIHAYIHTYIYTYIADATSTSIPANAAAALRSRLHGPGAQSSCLLVFLRLMHFPVNILLLPVFIADRLVITHTEASHLS
jgi:hypothetical protein